MLRGVTIQVVAYHNLVSWSIATRQTWITLRMAARPRLCRGSVNMNYRNLQPTTRVSHGGTAQPLHLCISSPTCVSAQPLAIPFHLMAANHKLATNRGSTVSVNPHKLVVKCTLHAAPVYHVDRFPCRALSFWMSPVSSICADVDALTGPCDFTR
jgi:hypothetical protein